MVPYQGLVVHPDSFPCLSIFQATGQSGLRPVPCHSHPRPSLVLSQDDRVPTHSSTSNALVGLCYAVEQHIRCFFDFFSSIVCIDRLRTFKVNAINGFVLGIEWCLPCPFWSTTQIVRTDCVAKVGLQGGQVNQPDLADLYPVQFSGAQQPSQILGVVA